MKKCVFAGSFDPITKGHMEIIEKASKLFDEVVVGLLYNQDKKYTFSANVRGQAVTDACAKIKNVTVKSFDGRLVDFLKQENTVYFVRGLRNEKDYKYEERITALKNIMQDKQVSISIGVLWREQVDDLEALLKSADKLMYMEKEMYHKNRE